MTNNQRLRLAAARERRKATLASIAEAANGSRTEYVAEVLRPSMQSQVISE